MGGDDRESWPKFHWDKTLKLTFVDSDQDLIYAASLRRPKGEAASPGDRKTEREGGGYSFQDPWDLALRGEGTGRGVDAATPQGPCSAEWKVKGL